MRDCFENKSKLTIFKVDLASRDFTDVEPSSISLSIVYVTNGKENNIAYVIGDQPISSGSSFLVTILLCRRFKQENNVLCRFHVIKNLRTKISALAIDKAFQISSACGCPNSHVREIRNRLLRLLKSR